jgi:hypothetical protein
MQIMPPEAVDTPACCRTAGHSCSAVSSWSYQRREQHLVCIVGQLLDRHIVVAAPKASIYLRTTLTC